jgi:predicted nucleotidyltransferase
MLSLKHSLSPTLVAIIQLLNQQNMEYFLVGAMAREILLFNVFEKNEGRVTRDVDFAVAVKSWSHFAKIKAGLIASSTKVRQDNQIIHRLYYDNEAGDAYPLDIIPFKGVENPKGAIKWPPDESVVMNITGYDDAMRASVAVAIENDIQTRIASLPALALLKILAWRDRRLETQKDAQDLLTLMRNYDIVENTNRLYNSAELLSLFQEKYDFQLDRSLAWLLGHDVAMISSTDTLAALGAALSDKALTAALARDMTTFYAEPEATVPVATLLGDFIEGFHAI